MYLSLTSAYGFGLLLQVHPQGQDDSVARGNKGASNTAEGDGARVPGRAHEHICHDGECHDGVLRKGHEPKTSRGWGSVRAIHDPPIPGLLGHIAHSRL